MRLQRRFRLDRVAKGLHYNHYKNNRKSKKNKLTMRVVSARRKKTKRSDMKHNNRTS